MHMAHTYNRRFRTGYMFTQCCPGEYSIDKDGSCGTIDNENEGRSTIVFDQSKNELFKLNDNWKTIQRKLRNQWKIHINKDDITSETFQDAAVFVLPSPRDKFTEAEFNEIKKFLDSGGSLLVTLGEGGEKKFETNINYLLEEYGIMINNDSVVRTHYYKYFHPKECLIPNGVLNRGIAKFLGKEVKNFSQCMSFIYPYGATLNTAKPAVPILSNGTISFPLNRPVCAITVHNSVSKSNPGGKMAVIGSGHIFSDRYLEKEDNLQVLNLLLTYLTTDNLELNPIDIEDPEISENRGGGGDTKSLSEKIRGCLMETAEELPFDYTVIFDSSSLYSVSLSSVHKVLEAYNQLGVKHEPLRLVPPSFDAPLPPLQIAVYPPRFADVGMPQLELFDLQEEFYSETARLCQAANKALLYRSKGSSPVAKEAEIEDVEYFVSECALVVGLGAGTAHSILNKIAIQLAQFKKNLAVK
ncbi:intraflagellar transport protein 52 homolog isoform X1 [Halyomorpha halys]|uniref:intraflagellar transport protein 52 homolog isoform X1 n=1 Tax=Halyomorpha halys TaxID=286706 RepID=UPI0006D4D457|nr:intraflagellar transport protein 52 homolog isoform X1 [Halyomorpha halys]